MILQRVAPHSRLSEQAGSSIVHQLELDWSSGYLLNDNRSRPNFPVANDITDLDLHLITAAKFAVDGNIEERSISGASMLMETEADRPDLWGPQRTLRADFAFSVPRHHERRDQILIIP